jgi:hypothetical protein
MMRWGAVLLLAACSTENPDLVIERQHTLLEDTNDADWKRGSVIMAGDVAGFTFPQAVALRFTIVDDATLETPTAQLIAQPSIDVVSGPASVSITPECQPMYCTAELSITELGEAMFAIEADGPEGGERDCFYYAVVDAGTDTDALRMTLEAQQSDCRFEQ